MTSKADPYVVRSWGAETTHVAYLRPEELEEAEVFGANFQAVLVAETVCGRVLQRRGRAGTVGALVVIMRTRDGRVARVKCAPCRRISGVTNTAEAGT